MSSGLATTRAAVLSLTAPLNASKSGCPFSSAGIWIILSGIRDYYTAEELIGKTLVAITNLSARTMMGIDSCGMIISAIHEEENKEKLNLIILNNEIPAGAKLY